MLKIVDGQGLYLVCVLPDGTVLVDREVDITDIIELLREASRETVLIAAKG